MLKLYFIVELDFDPTDPKIVAGPYFSYSDACYSSFMNEVEKNEEYNYDIRSATIGNVEWGY